MADLDPAGIEAAVKAYAEGSTRYTEPNILAALPSEPIHRLRLADAIAAYLSRVSSSRVGSVAVEDALEEARSVLLDVSRTRRSDAWGMVVNRANAWLAEFSLASTGDQAPEDDRST